MNWRVHSIRMAAVLAAALTALAPAASDGATPAARPSTFLGVFSLPPEQANNWPFAVTRASPEDVFRLQGTDLRALVALTGAKRTYSDAKGCFQLALWKQALDRQDPVRIQALVDQGVLKGLYAIDEPHDWPCGPSFEDIDAACAYANQKWPNLPCGVNAPPAWLRPGAAKLKHLGFLFFQYANNRGDSDAWLQKQLSDASWFKGDLWLSIQILRPRMGVAEFRTTALRFCAVHPKGLLMWKWSDEWFAQPGVASAMRDVANACGSPISPAFRAPSPGAG